MGSYSTILAQTINGEVALTPAQKAMLENKKHVIDCGTTYGRIEAYHKCDMVRSVLGVSSSYVANLNIWALDPSTGKLDTSTFAKKELAKLFRPNPKEDKNIFFKKLDSQVKLHGECFVRKVKAFGDEFYYVIPYQYVTVVYGVGSDLNSDRTVIEYNVNDGGSSYTLKPSEVHVFSDVVLSDDGYSFFGDSRLESLSEVISTYVTIWEVLTELYGNRGALNLISMGINDAKMMSLSQTQNEVSSIEKALRRFGLRRDQNKNMVTQFDAKVNKLSADMREMMFVEIIKECKKSIANAYNTPAELFGIESARYKTVPEARKEAYTQGAIPTFEYYLSEWFVMRGYTSQLPCKFAPDFSHLDFYQESKLQESIGFQQMSNAVVPLFEKGLITLDEARVKLDM
jgi:hypothetical protein